VKVSIDQIGDKSRITTLNFAIAGRVTSWEKKFARIW